jgi:hypothetical protein
VSCVAATSIFHCKFCVRLCCCIRHNGFWNWCCIRHNGCWYSCCIRRWLAELIKGVVRFVDSIVYASIVGVFFSTLSILGIKNEVAAVSQVEAPGRTCFEAEAEPKAALSYAALLALANQSISISLCGRSLTISSGIYWSRVVIRNRIFTSAVTSSNSSSSSNVSIAVLTPSSTC